MSQPKEADKGCIVLTTIDDTDKAREISRQLVQQKLAACVNMVPNLCSVYEWQGNLTESQEVLLIIKTVWQKWPALCATIHQIHPYELPEIVALDIKDGFQDYLSWLTQATSGSARQVD